MRGTPLGWAGSLLTLLLFAYAAKLYYPAKQPMHAAAAQQFEDFIHGRPGESTFELQSSSHTVDFLLPAAHDRPQEYHLVFRNPAERAMLFVQADFSVNAE